MAETATAPAPLPDVAPASAAAPPGATITPPVATLPSGAWRPTLPDEMKAEPSLGGFKDVGALAKAWVETKRLVGDAVKVPKPDASPEERAAFHRKLGVPQSPDQYGETVTGQLGRPAG